MAQLVMMGAPRRRRTWDEDEFGGIPNDSRERGESSGSGKSGGSPGGSGGGGGNGQGGPSGGSKDVNADRASRFSKAGSVDADSVASGKAYGIDGGRGRSAVNGGGWNAGTGTTNDGSSWSPSFREQHPVMSKVLSIGGKVLRVGADIATQGMSEVGIKGYQAARSAFSKSSTPGVASASRSSISGSSPVSRSPQSSGTPSSQGSRDRSSEGSRIFGTSLSQSVFSSKGKALQPLVVKKTATKASTKTTASTTTTAATTTPASTAVTSAVTSAVLQNPTTSAIVSPNLSTTSSEIPLTAETGWMDQELVTGLKNKFLLIGVGVVVGGVMLSRRSN